MRLLLDEMWSNKIAAQLRHRGHDVISATEREHAGRYSNTPDSVVFARAQDDGSAIVTDNIATTKQYGLRMSPETSRTGVIYPLSPAFDRHRGDRVIGPRVEALERFLNDYPGVEPLNTVHYLRPVHPSP